MGKAAHKVGGVKGESLAGEIDLCLAFGVERKRVRVSVLLVENQTLIGFHLDSGTSDRGQAAVGQRLGTAEVDGRLLGSAAVAAPIGRAIFLAPAQQKRARHKSNPANRSSHITRHAYRHANPAEGKPAGVNFLFLDHSTSQWPNGRNALGRLRLLPTRGPTDMNGFKNDKGSR
jgi:hypothetical protein